jgi:hypothetical protein
MIYYIDIDGTICITEGTNYTTAIPIPNRIQEVNKLYEDGHTVVYWTARGTGSGTDLYALTLKQLKGWGCKFTTLKTGKPVYDLFVEDRSMHPDNFFS